MGRARLCFAFLPSRNQLMLSCQNLHQEIGGKKKKPSRSWLVPFYCFSSLSSPVCLTPPTCVCIKGEGRIGENRLSQPFPWRRLTQWSSPLLALGLSILVPWWQYNTVGNLLHSFSFPFFYYSRERNPGRLVARPGPTRPEIWLWPLVQ